MDASERKRLLDMALSRAKPGSGSTLNRIRETPARYDNTELLPNLGAFPFAVVGGLATSRYMPERMTLNTDILIAAPDLTAVAEALRAQGCIKLGTLAIGGSTWRMPGGRMLDVLALDRDWVADAIHSATADDCGFPVVALPFLVLMKLEAGRLQDLADIGRMLGFATEDRIAATRKTVSRYRPQDVEDLDSMILLGKREHQEAWRAPQ